MAEHASDFLNADFIKADFIRNYQTLAQQSWDAWTRQLQQPTGAAEFFKPPQMGTKTTGDTLERTLTGLKGYLDWMNEAAATGFAPNDDWQGQLQHWFGGATPPFAQAFAGIDSAGTQGFARQWQDWMRSAQNSSLGDMAGTKGPTPAFGMDREQQMQQQAFAEAVMASMQASARYQALIQRSSAQGLARLQDKLAQHAKPGQQVESLKALYGLWVDAAEEAYAEIALTDEFREAYGEMVNAQMRVRQLQQKQTEQMCQQLGVPTRSEVSSLGERLQALRREFRASYGKPVSSADDDGELAALRREVAALRRAFDALIDAVPARKPAATKRSVARAKPAAKKATRVTAAKVPTTKKVAGKVATKKVATKKVAVKKAVAKRPAAKTSASTGRAVAKARKQASGKSALAAAKPRGKVVPLSRSRTRK
ncbi:MAG: poly(R)-hydroxyalkanoic acid synthase subunit PhaE [Rhodanobacter sp.]